MNENETNIISKMSIKVIGGGVYLKNRPQTITITWEIKDENGNIITPDTLSVNNIPLDPTTTSKTYHRVFSDVDFTVRAVKDGVLAIGTTTARFVGPTQTVEDSLTSNSRSIAASANSVRLLNEKIENNSSFKGLFTSLDDLKKKLRSGNNGDWAIVGEGIPAPIYIWNKNGWEATGGQYTGSTIDLDNYYTKENVANYTDDYNVSKNHSRIVKIYDLVNWKVVERKPDAPVFQLGQSYDSGEVVNMTDDNGSSYECLQSTITAPYLNQEVRSFTLAEAISFLPEDLRVTGQKVSFYSSELNAWMTYVFTGGDYTNPTYWEIFTNNIDPDTNQKIADLQAKDEDLQNQINEDVTNLNNHIAESDAKFEEIDNTLSEHKDRMDDIEDEILLSSVEAACAPKDVEILADRAYKDHLGNIIADEYITRDTLTEEIIDITNQQVTDIKPGSIQPEDLSEAVKQMFGAKKITNLPDEEDITVTEDNTLRFKDREYSPKDYSGMGKKILRKHYIDGVNTLTQHMINKPNTIYVIRYDYCLQEQTIEIPENCVLEFDGGSFRNGHLIFKNTLLLNKINIKTSVSGTVKNKFLNVKQFNYIEGKDCLDLFKELISISNIEIPIGEYLFSSSLELNINDRIIKGENKYYTLFKNTEGVVSNIIKINGSKNIHIQNISFYGKAEGYPELTLEEGARAMYGIYITEGNDITIKDCLFDGLTGGVIGFAGTSHINIDNCVFSNMKFIKYKIDEINGSGGYGVVFQQDNDNKILKGPQCCKVTNCVFEKTVYRHAAYIQDCDDFIFSNNISYGDQETKITRAEGHIVIRGSRNVLVSGNSFYGRVFAISFNPNVKEEYSDNVIINSNSFIDQFIVQQNRGTIDVSFSNHVNITNNTFKSKYYTSGIKLGDGNSFLIDGNIFYYTQTDDLQIVGRGCISKSTGNIIKDIIISNNIFDAKISSSIINIYRNGGDESIPDSGLYNMIIVNNIFKNVERYGIELFTCRNVDGLIISGNSFDLDDSPIVIQFAQDSKELKYGYKNIFISSNKIKIKGSRGLEDVRWNTYISNCGYSHEANHAPGGILLSSQKRIFNISSANKLFDDNIEFKQGDLFFNTIPSRTTPLLYYCCKNSYGDNYILPFFANANGESSERLSLRSTDVGVVFYDTTLKKPIWWTGSKWVDATGADV